MSCNNDNGHGDVIMIIMITNDNSTSNIAHINDNYSNNGNDCNINIKDSHYYCNESKNKKGQE